MASRSSARTGAGLRGDPNVTTSSRVIMENRISTRRAYTSRAGIGRDTIKRDHTGIGTSRAGARSDSAPPDARRHLHAMLIDDMFPHVVFAGEAALAEGTLRLSPVPGAVLAKARSVPEPHAAAGLAADEGAEPGRGAGPGRPPLEVQPRRRLLLARRLRTGAQVCNTVQAGAARHNLAPAAGSGKFFGNCLYVVTTSLINLDSF